MAGPREGRRRQGSGARRALGAAAPPRRLLSAPPPFLLRAAGPRPPPTHTRPLAGRQPALEDEAWTRELGRAPPPPGTRTPQGPCPACSWRPFLGTARVRAGGKAARASGHSGTPGSAARGRAQQQELKRGVPARARGGPGPEPSTPPWPGHRTVTAPRGGKATSLTRATDPFRVGARGWASGNPRRGWRAPHSKRSSECPRRAACTKPHREPPSGPSGEREKPRPKAGPACC